ncbi:Wadjet anti-phage system protein JetD domain-containing protein [Mycobacterium sp. DL440]|uniref:Wadjet anti-phage system protein JetD domain-containing protein n=2 Tax=Actinomycetes TaxID=1760 RepID=UPI0014221C6A|nr:Wadjet anti-phage system protein JetD domain-containing protein [Mycobacterium sp. DL440]
MLTVEDAIAEVIEICRGKMLAWARGLGLGPLCIALRPPKKLHTNEETVTAQQVWATWRLAIEAGMPGEVTPVRRATPHKLNTVELASKWELPIDAAWNYCPELHNEYLSAGARFRQAADHPAIIWGSASEIPDGAATKIAALAEEDWAHALEVINRLAAGPGQAMMVRQLAVPGVHSKWIEQNASLLCTLIGLTKAGPDDGTPLERLLRQVGIQAKEAPIHIALRCPKLRATAAQLAAFHASIRALNNSTIDPPVLLIIENDELGYTITADIDGLVIIHGLGAAAPLLAGLNWCHTARVLYWGDIDRAGLSILATLRRAGIKATSVLMDPDTLDRFDDQAHNTRSQKGSLDVPVELTETERMLYQQLNEHYQADGVDWQLEQEALDPQYALDVIAAAAEHALGENKASGEQNC